MVKGKFFPGLETDDLVIAHFKLDTTLLATKAAMGFHKSIWFQALVKPWTRRECQMWAEGIDKSVSRCG
jgi:hypothetical protein